MKEDIKFGKQDKDNITDIFIIDPQPINDVSVNIINKHNEPNESRAQKVASWLGFGATTLAMVPQAFLGALLADRAFLYFYHKYHDNEHLSPQEAAQFARVVLDVFFGLSAGIGKLAIVHYYNDAGFKAMGTEKYWEELFDRKTWTIKDIVNQVWSLIPSAVFAYIGKLSMDGIAVLLEDLHAKEIASWFKWYPLQITAAVFPFVTNFKGFPFIHKAGLGLIKSLGEYCVENPTYREEIAELSRKMESVRMHILALIKNQEVEEAKKWLQELGITKQTNFSTLSHENLRAKLIDVYNELKENSGNNSFKEVDPISWKEFLLKNGVGIAGIATVITGFYNFPFITLSAAAFAKNYISWQVIIEGITSTLHLPAITLSKNMLQNLDSCFDGFAQAAAAMDYLSMSAMSEGVYYLFYNAIEKACGHRVGLDPTSFKEKALILTIVALACASGVSPNVYQTIALAKTAAQLEGTVTLAVFAGLASAVVEFGGFNDLVTGKIIAKKNEKNPQTTFFVTADKAMLKATAPESIKTETPENLAKLAEKDKKDEAFPSKERPIYSEAMRYRSQITQLFFKYCCSNTKTETEEEEPLVTTIKPDSY